MRGAAVCRKVEQVAEFVEPVRLAQARQFGCPIGIARIQVAMSSIIVEWKYLLRGGHGNTRQRGGARINSLSVDHLRSAQSVLGQQRTHTHGRIFHFYAGINLVPASSADVRREHTDLRNGFIAGFPTGLAVVWREPSKAGG